MGAEGAFARVLGPIVGNQIDYASVDSKEKTGPGQLSEREFMDIYHYPSLNPATAIYGLIGDPIEHSIGTSPPQRRFSKTQPKRRLCEDDRQTRGIS